MKKYKILHLYANKFIISISKTGGRDGWLICFLKNGQKYYQQKYKNGVEHGIDKGWDDGDGSKNEDFVNWKKDKLQGIKILFK